MAGWGIPDLRRDNNDGEIWFPSLDDIWRNLSLVLSLDTMAFHSFSDWGYMKNA